MLDGSVLSQEGWSHWQMQAMLAGPAKVGPCKAVRCSGGAGCKCQGLQAGTLGEPGKRAGADVRRTAPPGRLRCLPRGLRNNSALARCSGADQCHGALRAQFGRRHGREVAQMRGGGETKVRRRRLRTGDKCNNTAARSVLAVLNAAAALPHDGSATERLRGAGPRQVGRRRSGGKT